MSVVHDGTLENEASPLFSGRPKLRRAGRWAMLAGLTQFVLAIVDLQIGSGWLAFLLSFGVFTAGAYAYIHGTYAGTLPGIKNDGVFFHSLSGRKVEAYLLGVALTGLYSALYWRPDFIAGATKLVNPLSQLLRGRGGDQWFMYGFIYTLAVLVMGTRMIWKYRHSRYHRFRTLSVMFFQLSFGFMVPALLLLMNQKEFYFSYFWPLKADYLFPGTFDELWNGHGRLGIFMFLWGVAGSFVITPLLTWRFGKRWYCSWVCGCGALAETAGDPFRQLSDKRRSVWRFERWSIHLVLVLITLVTVLLWVNSATDGAVVGDSSHTLSRWYGFVVGMALSGVVGVGFYPLLGSRVWCRFFCPMAAIMGIIQRFASRFRITTNGAQCISCGNCSTYCEMGIDVRAYAQRGENIVRASCVGCGVCAAVCPRGVLRLESTPIAYQDRVEGAENPLADLVRSLRTW